MRTLGLTVLVFELGRELELLKTGLLLLLLVLLLMTGLLLITGFVLTIGLIGLLLFVGLLLITGFVGKYVRPTDVRPSETENNLDLIELE
jgi:hypothetical protein